MQKLHRQRMDEELTAAEYRELKESTIATISSLEEAQNTTSTRQERTMKTIRQKMNWPLMQPAMNIEKKSSGVDWR